MRSFNNKLKSIITFKHRVNNFSSILKNKDQSGETDKSYSGTDSKHTFGSDRVVEDKKKSPITSTPNDSSVHTNAHKQPKHADSFISEQTNIDKETKKKIDVQEFEGKPE